MWRIITILGLVGMMGGAIVGFNVFHKNDNGENSLVTAQPFQPTYVVGLLDYNLFLTPTLKQFTHTLEELAERDNFHVEYKSVKIPFRPESLERGVAILANERVDIIVTGQGAIPYIWEKMPQTPTISVNMFNVKAAQVILHQPAHQFVFLDSSAAQIVEDRLSYALKLMPQMRTLLVPHVAEDDPLFHSEAMNNLREAAVKHHLALVEKGFSTREELNKFFLTYDFSKIDAIFRYPDSFISSNLDILLHMSRQPMVSKPLIVRNRTALEEGGLIAYGTDVEDLGAVAADVAYDILVKKIPPSDISLLKFKNPKLGVNTSVAKALGIEIPPSFLEEADYIVE